MNPEKVLSKFSDTYEVIEEIDALQQNSFVFHGRHAVLKTEVCLKMVLLGSGFEGAAEARALRATSGSGVVTLEQAFVDSGFLVLVTPWSPEGNLQNHLGCDPLQAKLSALSIVEGVSRLHAGGLVHGDLKPGNLLARPENKRNPVEIMDFGSVRTVDANTGEAVGYGVHSALYRPPEVFDGGGYTFASDVYQIALVILELLCGALQYDVAYYEAQAKSLGVKSVDEAIAVLAKAGKLASLDNIPFCAGHRFYSLVRNALALDPSDRPRLFEMAVDIAEIPALPWKGIDGGWQVKFMDRIYRVEIEGEKGVLARTGTGKEKFSKIQSASGLTATRKLFDYVGASQA
jgi:serine/threonine protein kinase